MPTSSACANSIAAIDAFFRDLPDYAGLPPSRILFTVEGFRYPEVAAANAGSYLDRVRRALLEKAQSLGYDAIDLDPPFFDHYRRTGERVELPRDGHWNGAYHGVVSDEVLASRFIARLVPEHAGATGNFAGARASYDPPAAQSAARTAGPNALNRRANSEIMH